MAEVVGNASAVGVHPRRVVRPRVRRRGNAALPDVSRPGGMAGSRVRCQDIAITLVLFELAFWQNLSDLRLTPFHPDETRWLNRAHYVRDLFDPFGPTWDDGYLTRGQPPLGSYLMGVGLLAHGRDLTTNGVWDFKLSRKRNTALGNMADRADLDAGRRTNAFVGALSVVVVYFLVKRLSNRVGGVAAALFLAAHPLMIYLSSQAVSDALLFLLVALAALAACRLADRPSWSRLAVLGILLGLGGATKLTPLLLALPLGGLGGLLVARAYARRRGLLPSLLGPPAESDRSLDEQLGRMLLALPVVALITFIVVYPYLWPDPIGRTVNLFAFRTEEMQRQGNNWPNVAVESRAEAMRRVGVTLGARFTTTGRLGAKLAHGLGREWQPRGIDLPFAVVGAEVLLALTVWRSLASRYALAAIVLGGQAGAVVLGMRSDWARYHLPVLLVVATCIGLLAGQLWSLASRPVVLGFLRQAVYRGLDRLVPGETASLDRRPSQGTPGAGWEPLGSSGLVAARPSQGSGRAGSAASRRTPSSRSWRLLSR